MTTVVSDSTLLEDEAASASQQDMGQRADVGSAGSDGVGSVGRARPTPGVPMM